MSWLVVLMKVPPEIKAFDENWPEDFMVPPLGSKADVLAVLEELFPDADFVDPTWVTLKRDDYYIEFGVGDQDPVESLGFRPHGTDGPISALQLLCKHTGWRAYDTSSGEFIEFGKQPA